MLIVAVFLDIKTGRIPNSYNGFWLIYGLVMTILLRGLSGLLYSAVGLFIPVAGLMVLFALGVLGGGDIKLFGVVGVFAGFDIFWIIVYSFVLCGIYGCILVMIRLLKGFISGDFRLGLIRLLTRQGEYTRVAFSVFIFGGFAWYVLRGGFVFGV